jgi:DNA polymerase
MKLRRILTLDFETRSACPLKSYRRYATHPTTGVLCIGLQWCDMTEGRTWAPAYGPVATPADSCPEEVLTAIREGFPVYAHNVAFDRTMWLHYCVPVLGWPEIPFEQWRCTMAVCAYYAVPQGLAKAARALGLVAQKQTKEEPGKLALSQCCKPRRPLKAEVDAFREAGISSENYPVLWREDERRLRSIREYCKQDVRTQTELLIHLGELPPDRLNDWMLDQKINERGVPLDFPNLVCASSLVDKTLGEASAEINRITGGAVSKVTSRDQILDYLHMQNVHLDSLDKEAVETALAEPSIQGVPRQVLELRQLAGRSSLAKVEAMLEHIDTDGRVRNGLNWHGASTGRWAGRGVQWQNFPRECLSTKDADELFALMEQVGDNMGYYDDFALMMDVGVPKLLTQALRAFIKPAAGKGLLISDFAAIECRVLSWMAGCDLLQEAFRKGECPYSQFASRATGKTVVKGMPERQLGKVCILALGYGMGAEKLKETAGKAPYHIPLTEEKAEAMKGLYRGTYADIPKFWANCEASFIRAVESQSMIRSGRLVFGCNGKWAWIQLPSGRCIWYYEPQVGMAKTPWGAMRKQASYMTVNPVNKQWVRAKTYGGLLTENCIQAISACLLTAAMRRIEDAGIPVIASIHDEVVSECEDAPDRFDEFHQLMEVVPAWASGCYISAESHVAGRYGK